MRQLKKKAHFHANEKKKKTKTEIRETGSKNDLV